MKTITISILVAASAASVAAQDTAPPQPADVLFAAPLQPMTVPSFHFIAGGMPEGAPVKNAPYSSEAVTESIQTLADGNRIVNRSSSTIARDSEGRERREQSIADLSPFASAGESSRIVFISDPVAGVRYSLNMKDKNATKMPLNNPANGLAGLPPPPAGARVIVQRITGAAPFNAEANQGAAGGPVLYMRKEVDSGGGTALNASPSGPLQLFATTKAQTKVEQLGSKLIEGVQVTGTRTAFTIPAGQIGNDKAIDITDERWYSNELQVTVLSEHTDPRIGRTTYSLKNISRNEPSPALFQVPPDYTLKDAPEPFIQKLP